MRRLAAALIAMIGLSAQAHAGPYAGPVSPVSTSAYVVPVTLNIRSGRIPSRRADAIASESPAARSAIVLFGAGV